MRSWIAQLRKGLVELCILGVLRTRGEAYGYEIVQELSQSGALPVTESTIYPLLSRLKEDGIVAVRSAPSPSGPTRRYYRLTPHGVSRLGEMEAAWADIRKTINTLLEGGKA